MPKSVLITGCSAGGIGAAMAETFHKRGLQVFVTARNVAKMSQFENRDGLILLSLDVTSPSSIAAAVEAVKAQTGGTLDYLVNNSGAMYTMPALDSDIEKSKQMFDVNFWGVLFMVQAFAPLLIASKGTIVNTSSISGTLYAPWMSE
jgi:1-acylglycerone phosphate reductase